MFGSFRNEDYAVASAQAWTERGLALEVFRYQQGARISYRMVHGRYNTEAEALADLTLLKQQHGVESGYVWQLPAGSMPLQPKPETTETLRPARDTLVITHNDTVFVVVLPGTQETDTLVYRAPDGRVLQQVPVPHEGTTVFPSVARPQQDGLLVAVIDSLDHRLRVSVDMYVDVYYAAQSRQPDGAGLRQYVTPGLRNEQFGINTGQISARLDGERFRGYVTLHVGDVRTQGWDPVTSLALLQEAHVGVRLSPGLWLDAGLFTTHIGGEAILPRDNWISSLALVTYYEAFIQAGARLAWDITPKLQLQLHGLNGYNTVEDNNRSLSGGWLVTWLASDGITFFSSGIIGNEQPRDSANVVRTYTNTVMSLTPLQWLHFKMQFDYGYETGTVSRPSKEVMAGQATVQLLPTDKWRLALRGEFYRDPGAMLSPAVVAWGGTASWNTSPPPTAFCVWKGGGWVLMILSSKPLKGYLSGTISAGCLG